MSGELRSDLGLSPQENALQRAIGRYRDFLPQPGMLPDLSDDEVSRFVALDKLGWKKLAAGDPATSEAAFRAQIAIFPGNFEPYVSLGFVEVSRGRPKDAIGHVREAIVRGFTDLERLKNAELWRKARNGMSFYELEVYLPSIVAVDKSWAGWDDFNLTPELAPKDLAPVLAQRESLLIRVDRMAQALGPRLTPLWKKTIDRCTAARLEAYVAAHPDAPDLERAAAALLTLYTGGPTGGWEILPSTAAARVDAVAGLLLDRFPQSPLRPSALYCRALARNARRDERGALNASIGEQILAGLGDALASSPRAPFAPSAVAGLIRTEAALGRLDRASARYAELHDRYTGDVALWDDVRGQLGNLVLLAGGVPDFKAVALDGTEVAKPSLEGRVVVIDFWATWCRPCVEEFPTMRRIARHHGADVAWLGVNLDRSDSLSADGLRAWLAREKVPGRHVQDGLGWDSDLVRTFGVTEIPFTVVVGADGSVMAVNPRGKQLEKAVASALRAASADGQ